VYRPASVDLATCHPIGSEPGSRLLTIRISLFSKGFSETPQSCHNTAAIVWRKTDLRRRSDAAIAFVRAFARLPIVRPIMDYHRMGLFCGNLSLLLLLSSEVMLTSALRILVDTMESTGTPAQWSHIVDKVRHGGKLSDALLETRALPPMANRTLRLGEDSGQLAMLAGRIAGFCEAKLGEASIASLESSARSLLSSSIVGGLIVSVMTALLSVYQVVD
jgi:general secretion pathway protein F